MKTYLFPEVAGHGEITEWVPADVARELFRSVQKTDEILTKGFLDCTNEELKSERIIRKSALKKACGES